MFRPLKLHHQEVSCRTQALWRNVGLKYIWHCGDSSVCIIYRVIHKFLWDFRPLRYSSRDGHAEGEHVNSGRDTPSFCPTLQVLDMSTVGDAADVNPVIKFLSHTASLFVWQRTGSHSARISSTTHEFCP